MTAEPKDTFTRAEVAEILEHLAQRIVCLPGWKSHSDVVSVFASDFAEGAHDGLANIESDDDRFTLYSCHFNSLILR